LLGDLALVEVEDPHDRFVSTTMNPRHSAPKIGNTFIEMY